MASETKLAAVLVSSFLLWLPALTAFLRGDLGAGAIGVRFAGAVAVVWVSIAVVGNIASGYRAEPVAAADGGGSQRRRQQDPAVEASEHVTSDADPSTEAFSAASDG